MEIILRSRWCFSAFIVVVGVLVPALALVLVTSVLELPLAILAYLVGLWMLARWDWRLRRGENLSP